MYSELEETLKKRLGDLVEEAKQVAQKHWEYHLSENANREPSEKGRLNVYVRCKGETVEIYWAKYRFIKPNDGGRSRIRSTYLKRGRGNWYMESTLTRAGKAWEIAKAIEVERELGGIRAEVQSVKKALRYVREANKQMNERLVTAGKQEAA
ncbi:conjugative transfer protein MobI(A/C) [Marinobacter sp. P4B1]|uniref:conjugative transfer protein MobI(A/C) n=1 Tax=Marinobacter sp. P4B1 TaxID=1119533 RepID=UPI00071C6997|nr:conjugative transfer protein MobI(A/C) [Marinobacter sp. P4B1]KRW83640.1 hypothetical protein AQ621_16460 [Marinobacter sp. P4B1]